jgi:hypothetical protein
MREILVTGLIPCGGAGGLGVQTKPWTDENNSQRLRAAYRARSIAYNDEKYDLISITTKAQITSLNLHYQLRRPEHKMR